MTFTITLGWWVIPTLITVVSVIWALFIVDDGGGYLSGLGNLFALVPALIVSTISWIVGAVLK